VDGVKSAVQDATCLVDRFLAPGFMVCSMSSSDCMRSSMDPASVDGTDDLRAHSSLFSTAVFRTLSETGYIPAVPQLDRLIEAARPDTPLRDVFEDSFHILERRYRSEYVYKNAVVSKIVFGRHSPNTANALIEQPLGSSIADVLVVNGTTTAYEVKTDFDDFNRLGSQLADYSRHCERVNVVTSEKRAQKATELTPDHIGVIALRKSGALSVFRTAGGGTDRLNINSLYSMLRKHEALSILHRAFGYTPDTGSGRLHSQMRELFGTLPLEFAHAECVHALRLRGTADAALFGSWSVPPALRALIYGTPMSRAGRNRLMIRLERPAAAYTLTV
jgi:hypothetical protein